MSDRTTMAKAKASLTKRQAGLRDSLRWQGGLNSQQLLQSGVREAFKACGGVLDKIWGNLPQQMVDPRYNAEVRQQPGMLEARQFEHTSQKSACFVGVLFAEGIDVLRSSERRP